MVPRGDVSIPASIRSITEDSSTRTLALAARCQFASKFRYFRPYGSLTQVRYNDSAERPGRVQTIALSPICSVIFRNQPSLCLRCSVLGGNGAALLSPE
jgi:hypothetical protein